MIGERNIARPISVMINNNSKLWRADSLVMVTTLKERNFYHPHFIDETEVQRDPKICPRSHS